MPSGHQQRDGGRVQAGRIRGDEVHCDVCGEMVDAVERQPRRRGQSLRSRSADHEGAGQPRPSSDGERVEVVQSHAGIRERLLDHRADRLHVRAGGDLRHDPAEPHVLVHRCRDGVREQGAAADDAHAGLIARRLDAEDQRFGTGHPISSASAS